MGLVTLFALPTAVAFLFLFSNTQGVPVTKEETPSAVAHPEENSPWFEGDLKISQEFIDHHYKAGGDHAGASRRAAPMDDDSRRWPNNLVIWDYDSGVTTNFKNAVQAGMTHWSTQTCLRFQRRSSTNPESDYILFTESQDDGCYSDSIGRDGGKQIINLDPGTPSTGTCQTMGIAAHEIGHAIGFWHEQTRPDRDSYVKINDDNIKFGKGGNFEKRDRDEVDYQGEPYDYGSIMHYSTTAFSSNNKPTITVTNNAYLAAQNLTASSVGQRNGLSAIDLRQARRLFRCPGTSVTGSLQVILQVGYNLPDTDTDFLFFSNDPDPYVVVEAVSSTGALTTKTSSKFSGTRYPNFGGQIIDFGLGNWQYFRVQVRDDDSPLSPDDNTQSMTVPVQAGTYKNLLNCGIDGCGGYLRFDYRLDQTNECSSNPCLNGGTCTNGIGTYTCSCKAGFLGSNCQLAGGSLTVKVKNGASLPNADGAGGESDPYVILTAYTSLGTSVKKITPTDWESNSPTWNSVFAFGSQPWNKITLQVWDDDSDLDYENLHGATMHNPPDALSSLKTVTLSKGSFTNVKVSANSGSIFIDYTFL